MATNSEDSLSCKYRVETEDGVLKCAVGYWIPDEVYSGEMEGKGVEKLIKWLSARARGGKEKKFLKFCQKHSELLKRLQIFHDCVPPCHWATRGKELKEELFGSIK